MLLYHPLWVVEHALLKGSPCSLREVWRGAQVALKLESTTRDWEARVKLKREDSAGYNLWATPAGDVWLPKGSESALSILTAQQEVRIYDVDGQTVRPGTTVLDCGAHVGLFARAALKAGAARVIAIEPSPQNLECLRRNLVKEIAEGRVTVVPKGVWHKEEHLTLYQNPFNTAGDTFTPNPGSGNIPAGVLPLTTIDLISNELSLPRIDLIKMDIKGAAANAIQGASAVIASSHPRFVIALEDGDTLDATTAAFRAVRANYQVACGMCVPDGNQVWPEVVLFQ